ncbi:MAG: hypothetical protein PHI85_01420 [Victivallaceae bacterium]|nr:hypothetical protein [Victivallaceae bacterium]
MKKIFVPLLSAAMLVLCGCRTSSVTFTRPENPEKLESGEKVVARMSGENTSYYLFNLIPLFCGNPYRPNTGDYTVFKDQLSEISNEYMLDQAAKKWLNADGAVNFSHSRRFAGAFSLWIVCVEVIESKATAVEK